MQPRWQGQVFFREWPGLQQNAIRHPTHVITTKKEPKGTKLRIASFNVKNINANMIALQTLMKKSDVIAIQEHWLFNYEQKVLNDIDPFFNSWSRSVDDLQPISPFQKPRGYGGTAFLWRKDLDDVVKELPDGNERIICIEVTTTSVKLCLICTYMPCRGGGVNCESEFQEALDILHEIYTKYQDSHSIILMGDLNGSITKEIPNARDKKLTSFCRDHDIDIRVPKQDTFFHVNGRDSNQSDYILSKRDATLKLGSYSVMDYELLPTNVSDHIPVQSHIEVGSRPRGTKPKAATYQQRINWDKIDKGTYNSITAESSVLSIEGNHQLSLAVDNLIDRLNDATADSYVVPPKKHKKSNKGLDLWSPEIAILAKRSKESNYAWALAGKPRLPDHPTVIERKMTKCKLRSAIRRSRAISRKRVYEEIMEANGDDKMLFYKLIQRQRSTKSTDTDTLIIDGSDMKGDEQVMQGFKKYYEDLAVPKVNDDYCEVYKATADFKEVLLCDLYQHRPDYATFIEPLSIDDIRKIISSCKNGKAQDSDKITAEHFKYAGDGVLQDLLFIINSLLKSKFIPPRLLHGTLTPILKKSKDKKNPSNYRGITVTSVIGKILEKAWLMRANPIILSKQNRLQRGFTAQCSSTNAALLITEAIAEAKDCRNPLYITFLDATKAFDVVQHSILMDDCHRMGIQGDLWLMLRQFYSRPTTALKWKSSLSEPFIIQQGVRQGGASSAPLYKCYTNPLLDQLQNQHTHRIGSIDVSASTCADDTAILAAQPEDMQAALNTVKYYANEHHYGINPSKSASLSYNTQLQPLFHMSDSDIPYPEEYTHLGIVRNQNNQLNVDERIQTARKTAYALMGAGFHGKDGLAPHVSYHIWETYVIPRMLYGLEVISYKESDIKKLEAFQRKTLRQIQFLPEKPAPSNIAVYGLLGARSIKATVEQQTLTHFGNILRSEGSVEWDLANRQLAIKDDKSKSWFVHIKHLLNKYNLPSAYELLNDPPKKAEWKAEVTDAISRFHDEESRNEALTKSSLKYLNTNILSTGVAHHVWDTLSGNCREIEMAAVKARLLTGTYVLQANRAKFNQFEVVPTCSICNKEPEDRSHFILSCMLLEETRRHHIEKISRMLQRLYSCKTAEMIIRNQNVLLQLILDCTHESLSSLGIQPPLSFYCREIEPVTRLMCFSLHMRRASLLDIYVK